MWEFVEDSRDVDVYLSLREQVKWVLLDRKQAQLALDNSMKIITVYDKETPIGMGRIVGDGAVICYVQDLIVIPPYQRQHVGGEILDRLIAYVERLTAPGTRMMLCLMCAKGRELFYEKHGFVARPTDALGPGMIQYLYKQ